MATTDINDVRRAVQLAAEQFATFPDYLQFCEVTQLAPAARDLVPVCEMIVDMCAFLIYQAETGKLDRGEGYEQAQYLRRVAELRHVAGLDVPQALAA